MWRERGGEEGRRERGEEGERKGGGREEGEEGESGDEGGIRQQSSPLPYLLLPRLHGLGNLSQ